MEYFNSMEGVKDLNYMFITYWCQLLYYVRVKELPLNKLGSFQISENKKFLER